MSITKSAIVAMVVFGIIGFACAKGPDKQVQSKADGDMLLGIEDMPCADIQSEVARIIKSDPSLGLADTTRTPSAVAYRLPERQSPKDPGLWWQGVVLVECFQPTSSQISVQVKARRKTQSGWQEIQDVRELQASVLEGITRRLTRHR